MSALTINGERGDKDVTVTVTDVELLTTSPDGVRLYIVKHNGRWARLSLGSRFSKLTRNGRTLLHHVTEVSA